MSEEGKYDASPQWLSVATNEVENTIRIEINPEGVRWMLKHDPLAYEDGLDNIRGKIVEMINSKIED